VKKKIQALGATAVRCELGAVNESHLEGCDTIIHSAAHVDDWGSHKHYWNVNVEGTSQLLEAAQKADVSRFIHISTEATLFYGQHMRDIDETYPYPKKTPILYAKTKAEAERRVLAANNPQKNFATICLRPRLIWGPGDQTFLPIVKQMVETGTFVWVNKGQMKTSTVYIDNLVHAITLALTKGRGGETYFITDDKTQVFRDFLTKMMTTQNVNMPNKSIPGRLVRILALIVETIWRTLGIKSKPPITRHAAYLMSCDCILKIDKAKKELGYQPIISPEEGLAKMQN